MYSHDEFALTLFRMVRGGTKAPPLLVYACNFYKRRHQPPKRSDFYL